MCVVVAVVFFSSRCCCCCSCVFSYGTTTMRGCLLVSQMSRYWRMRDWSWASRRKWSPSYNVNSQPTIFSLVSRSCSLSRFVPSYCKNEWRISPAFVFFIGECMPKRSNLPWIERLFGFGQSLSPFRFGAVLKLICSTPNAWCDISF